MIQFLIDRKVGITSTLAVFEGTTTTQPQPPDEVLNAMSPDTREFYLKRYDMMKSAKPPLDRDMSFVKTARMERCFMILVVYERWELTQRALEVHWQAMETGGQ